MWIRVVVSVVLSAVLLTACGGSSGGGTTFADPQEWGFNFWSDSSRTVLLDTALVTMERGTNKDRGRIDIMIPGCIYALEFDVQFSGSLVRLLNFSRSSDSTCTGIQQTSEGTGNANGTYGSATEANGTGSIVYNSPIGPAGGPFFWEAFLQP